MINHTKINLLIEVLKDEVAGCTKVCTRCHQQIFLDDFNKSKDKPQGRSDWCKSCRKLHYKETYVSRRRQGQAEMAAFLKEGSKELFKDMADKVMWPVDRILYQGETRW